MSAGWQLLWRQLVSHAGPRSESDVEAGCFDLRSLRLDGNASLLHPAEERFAQRDLVGPAAVVQGSGGIDKLGEHAATADGLELVGVTDQSQPPPVLVGESGESVEVAGGEHAGFVDDDGGAGGESPSWVGWSVGAVPFVEEFGDGGHAAVGANPNTGRPCAARSVTAAWSMVVLPAPAGPTTGVSRSLPATVAAASACITSNPPMPMVVDGLGGSSWLSIAHDNACSSWANTSSLVTCRADGAIHTDRPSDARRREWSAVGSRSTQCSRI